MTVGSVGSLSVPERGAIGEGDARLVAWHGSWASLGSCPGWGLRVRVGLIRLASVQGTSTPSPARPEKMKKIKQLHEINQSHLFREAPHPTGPGRRLPLGRRLCTVATQQAEGKGQGSLLVHDAVGTMRNEGGGGGGKGEVPSEWVSPKQVSRVVGVRDWRKAIHFEAVRPAAAMTMTLGLGLSGLSADPSLSHAPFSPFPSLRPRPAGAYARRCRARGCWCQAGKTVREGWRGLPKPRRECDVKMHYGGWPAGIS